MVGDLDLVLYEESPEFYFLRHVRNYQSFNSVNIQGLNFLLILTDEKLPLFDFPLDEGAPLFCNTPAMRSLAQSFRDLSTQDATLIVNTTDTFSTLTISSVRPLTTCMSIFSDARCGVDSCFCRPLIYTHIDVWYAKTGQALVGQNLEVPSLFSLTKMFTLTCLPKQLSFSLLEGSAMDIVNTLLPVGEENIESDS